MRSAVFGFLGYFFAVFGSPLRPPQNGFCRYIVTNKVTIWAVSYSACVTVEFETNSIDHFTVVFLVTWPLNGNEAEGDLVLIQTLLLLLCKSAGKRSLPKLQKAV